MQIAHTCMLFINIKELCNTLNDALDIPDRLLHSTADNWFLNKLNESISRFGRTILDFSTRNTFEDGFKSFTFSSEDTKMLNDVWNTFIPQIKDLDDNYVNKIHKTSYIEILIESINDITQKINPRKDNSFIKVLQPLSQGLSWVYNPHLNKFFDRFKNEKICFYHLFSLCCFGDRIFVRKSS